MLVFSNFGDFSLLMRSFDHIYFSIHSRFYWCTNCKYRCSRNTRDIIIVENIVVMVHGVFSGGGEGSEWGIRPGRHCAGAAFGAAKVEFWNLAASSNFAFYCIQWYFTHLLSSNTPPVWDHTPNCQWSTTPHKVVCTPRNLHCWSKWSFNCCKTAEDPYCPVTVLVTITIQSIALFTCFRILHKIWKFCMSFSFDSQESR